MRFLDYDNTASYALIREKHDRYQEYVRANAELFPSGAYEFALADWHYDPSDHRCPHDAWLETIQINENGDVQRDHSRAIEIRILLKGAYHDGQVELSYQDVQGYRLDFVAKNGSSSRSHGDWLLDEVRLADDNSVVHEIKFWRGAVWEIACKDIRYKWLAHPL